MVSFVDILCRNPGFHLSMPSEDRIVVVGETESFLLSGRYYSDLFARIDSAQSISDIVSGSNDLRVQVQLLNAIDDLVSKGLIVEESRHGKKPVYVEPDFDAAPIAWQHPGGLLDLRILSRFEDPDALIRWASGLCINAPTGIVIADDYLDPRLSAINHGYRVEKRPWLLVKPTGVRPMIGPLFMPEKTASPCWECLSYRLIQNQPVRRWLQHKHPDKAIRIPVRCEKDTVMEVLAELTETAQEFIDGGISFSLKTMDASTMGLSGHHVSFLPQCPICGEPGASEWRSQNPLSLQSSPKTHIHDGGVRSVNPRQTLEKLQPLVSPMTGIVGDLSKLPDHDSQGVPIYRTFFFKTPDTRHIPENGSFMQVSLGKGLSAEQSMASAVCETVERYAVQFRGDEFRVSCPADKLVGRVVLPQQLAAFSEYQYRMFSDSMNPASRSHFAVSRYCGDIPMHWTKAWSLSDGKPYHVPLTYCYANTPFDEDRYARFNSNGCAAGNTLEEALLQGFLELVERDAVAVWWYNRVERPSVSLDLLPLKDRELIKATLAGEWEYWVLDLTHDFQIPVMAAVSRHKTTRHYRFGFGCHINPVLACQRALTELCQLIAIKNRGPVVFNFDAISDEPFFFPKNGVKTKCFSDFASIVHADIKDDVLYCIGKAAQHGFNTLAVDYTRPDIPMRTVRVVVPGLCHIWPQFGNSRLYTIPVAMGWIKSPLGEDQLNPRHLLI